MANKSYNKITHPFMTMTTIGVGLLNVLISLMWSFLSLATNFKVSYNASLASLTAASASSAN